jgi:hypothetical protein
MSNYCCICIDVLECDKLCGEVRTETHDEVLSEKCIEIRDTIGAPVNKSESDQLYFLNCCNNKIHKNCLLEWVICKGVIICPLCRNDPLCITVDDLLLFSGTINYNHLNYIVNKLVGNNLHIKIIPIEDDTELDSNLRYVDLDRNSTINFYLNLILYTLGFFFFFYFLIKFK